VRPKHVGEHNIWQNKIGYSCFSWFFYIIFFLSKDTENIHESCGKVIGNFKHSLQASTFSEACVGGYECRLSRQLRFKAGILLLYLLTSDHFQYLTGRETTRDREKQTDNRKSWDPSSNALKQEEMKYRPLSCKTRGNFIYVVSPNTLVCSSNLTPQIK